MCSQDPGWEPHPAPCDDGREGDGLGGGDRLSHEKGDIPSMPGNSRPKGSAQRREAARCRCSCGPASAQLHRRYLCPELSQPLLAARDIRGEQPADRIWNRKGGKEGEMLGEASGKPPPASCCILIGIWVPKMGREKGYAGRGKGRQGSAALAFVLQAQSLRCQAGSCPWLGMGPQSVSPQETGGAEQVV